MLLAQQRSILGVSFLQPRHAAKVMFSACKDFANTCFGCKHTRYKNSSSISDRDHTEVLSIEPVLINPEDIPFAPAKLGQFSQDGPTLGNQFLQDALLQGFLQQNVSSEYLPRMRKLLEKLGERVTKDIYQLSLRMESEPPRLEQMNGWGKRVDKLVTSTAWQDMKVISAQEGLVASGYEREFGEWSRLYQMAQFYLFEPSGGLYGCPLAMTNGAARTMELLQDNHRWLFDQTFPRLTSRDPDKFWTSGQWMTEKRGGSDVAGGTETMAVKQTDGSYKLFGYKWFSSATDADMTLTLARVVNQHGNMENGTRGLSLFYMDVKGEMSNIQIMKLKNKLGTRQLPTAELLINGARAFKVSEDGRGVSAMSQMLTLTRIHTAVHAAAAMRRIVNLARDYSCRRKAFGRVLLDHPLHMHTLANMEVETRAASIFVFEVARLLGRQETCNQQNEELEAEKNILRLTVPLLKLYVSKKSVAVVSEGLECFGGQGYIEDTDLPGLLRDTQVTPIWEGTTNILSLDVLRAIRKSMAPSSLNLGMEDYALNTEPVPQVLHYFKQNVLARIYLGKEKGPLQKAAVKIEKSLNAVLKHWASQDPSQQAMAAREMAYSLARIYMGALLLEHASHNLATATDVYTAQRWCERDLDLLSRRGDAGNFTPSAQDLNLKLVFDEYRHQNEVAWFKDNNIL